MVGRLRFQAVGMMGLSLAAQLVGLVRVSLVAASFGTNTEFDAFNLVTNLATFVFGFIGSGVTVLLIPAFMQSDNRRVLDTVQTCLYGVVAVGLVLLCWGRVPLLSAISFGRKDALDSALHLVSVVVVGQAIVAVVGVTSSYFQCQGMFNVPKVLNLVAVSVLLALVLADQSLSIDEYAAYLLFSNGLNLFVQVVWAIKIGYRFRPRFAWREPEVRRRMAMFGPIAVSTGVYQATVLIDTVIASSLGPGRVAMLSYMTSISGIMNAVVASNLVSFIYPRMSADVAKDVDTARRALNTSGLVLATVVAGFVAIFLVVGDSAVRALFQHGEFGDQDARMVYFGSVILLVVMPLDVVRDLIYRFFYANTVTMDPLVNSLVASAINMVLSLVLARRFDIYGVVLGTSIMAICSLTMICVRLRRRFGVFQFVGASLVIEAVKVVVAAGITVGVSRALGALLPPSAWLRVFVLGVASMLIYVGLLAALRSHVAAALTDRGLDKSVRD